MKHRKLLYSLAALLLAGLMLLMAQGAIAGDAAKWPQEGKSIKQDEKLKLDTSNTSEGYFMAKVSKKTSKKLKLRVITGDTTLDYDLPGTGDYIVVPLQMGSGKYKITLYENTSGKKYAAVGAITITAKLTREDGAFLYPNQYVDYDVTEKAVEKADELCAGKSEKESFDAVCAFMKTFVYDYVKAINIKPGMLPDIPECYAKKRGVCQDLSAVMCCMLRTQGIPCRLVIGYADKSYHAWTVAIIDGKEVFFDPTAALNAIKPKKYTVERFY